MRSLLSHIKVHTKEKPFFCSKCPGSDSSFVCSGSLKVHEVARHGLKHGKKCEQCPKMFYSIAQLKLHRRVHTGERPFSCSICQMKFAKKSTLKNHYLIHTKEKPWQCDECPKKFGRKDHLNSHVMRVHSNHRPHSCGICGKAFASKGNRDKHLTSHLNERPHRCPKCGKRFRRAEGLRKHLRAHDIKSTALTNKGTLSLHFMKIHTDKSGQPFGCVFCALTFARAFKFENHLISHIGEKPYICTLCSNSFSTNASLSRHMKFVHRT